MLGSTVLVRRQFTTQVNLHSFFPTESCHMKNCKLLMEYLRITSWSKKLRPNQLSRSHRCHGKVGKMISIIICHQRLNKLFYKRFFWYSIIRSQKLSVSTDEDFKLFNLFCVLFTEAQLLTMEQLPRIIISMSLTTDAETIFGTIRPGCRTSPTIWCPVPLSCHRPALFLLYGIGYPRYVERLAVFWMNHIKSWTIFPSL